MEYKIQTLAIESSCCEAMEEGRLQGQLTGEKYAENVEECGERRGWGGKVRGACEGRQD